MFTTLTVDARASWTWESGTAGWLVLLVINWRRCLKVKGSAVWWCCWLKHGFVNNKLAINILFDDPTFWKMTNLEVLLAAVVLFTLWKIDKFYPAITPYLLLCYYLFTKVTLQGSFKCQIGFSACPKQNFLCNIFLGSLRNSIARLNLWKSM